MRLRITFSKSGSMRYIGHLDLQTTWERTIRRAGLPLAYTQGFHPGPRIQIASALPLGFIGHAEIVDIWLHENVVIPVGAAFMAAQGRDKPRPYVEMMQTAAPPGLTILSVEQVDEKGPSLQTRMVSAEYVVTLLDPMAGQELAERLAAILQSESIMRERRGKPYDLRPLIESLSLAPLHLPPFSEEIGGEKEGGQVLLFMRLAAREGATGRPEEVMAVLGIPPESTRIERTRLILKTEIESAGLETAISANP
jgi:radical SAM-linked protein